MEQKISKDMTFGELIRSYPDTVSILGNYGLHCIGCHLSIYETIEQGMRAHGLDDAALDKLLAELNRKAGN